MKQIHVHNATNTEALIVYRGQSLIFILHI